MSVKFLKVLILILVSLFMFIVTSHYFSETNKILISKNRNDENIRKNINIDLPVLDNDTEDVIEFNTGYENSNNKKYKRNFWELFK
tara:strand:- start:329 stop:586 length:258 start_codon:yes stop_codon:yes gene_type:complete